MKRFFIAIIAIASTCLFTFCEKKTSEKQEKKETHEKAIPSSPEAIVAEYQQICDSVDFYWAEMMRSDDQKIADIKRLLQEVSYCKRYNQIALDSISKMAENLISKRYVQENMADESIDAYDAATDSLIRATFDLTQNTPELSKHSIVPELIEDITEADMTLWKYRKDYDDYALIYNQFIEENKETLKTIDSINGSLNKKPLFQIQQ
ncbi:hypothetical protein RCC89_09755 [Cytophagaceae bacterium ABcell3]|nr:hypothetical protein RCC89_09755 [Cytophagaceae bacterium ABcell3]